MAQVLQAEGRPWRGPQKLPTAAVLPVLGVVYGDIGTSTLCGLKQAVNAGGTPTPETVIGTVSLISWALLLIVGLKYAFLILRADNRDEAALSRCSRFWMQGTHRPEARAPPCSSSA